MGRRRVGKTLNSAQLAPLAPSAPSKEVLAGDTLSGVFLFKASIPAEVRETVHAAFLECSWLVPGWCQRVYVSWDGNGHSEAALSINVDYECRWAWVDVYPAWLNSGPQIRRENVIHELLHISLNVLWDYARETIETLLKEEAPRFHTVADKELRTRLESATQDLAFLIDRKLTAAP
jgi:hypothetical protein